MNNQIFISNGVHIQIITLLHLTLPLFTSPYLILSLPNLLLVNLGLRSRDAFSQKFVSFLFHLLRLKFPELPRLLFEIRPE